MKIENKFIGGNVIEVKQEDRNGVPIGLLKGYLATWDIDRGGWDGIKDQFVRGAFLKSINEHLEKRRPVRFKDHHGRTVGGFPIDSVFEDERGLFGTAEVNLEVQQGRELFSLARQGVISDFSVGFSIVDSSEDNGLRTIHEAMLFECSAVDEPMNPHANITEVKAVVPFQDLPLADQEREWDADGARARVREFTESTDEPSATYRRAFVWYDRAESDNFAAYKLPIADVINGRLTAVPRGIFAAAAAMSGARGGVDIPDTERDGVEAHINRYYTKMDLPSPIEAEGADKMYDIDDVQEWTPRDAEQALRKSGNFSRAAAKALASRMGEVDTEDKDGETTDDYSDWMNGIKSLTESLQSRA